MSRPDLELRIEDYLDGVLCPAETDRLERELCEPEAARALGEALMLRELLASAPPHEVPEGLVDRIESELGVAISSKGRRGLVPVPGLSGPASGVLEGASWALRWPSMMMSAAPAATAGPRQTMQAMRSLTDPLREALPERPARPKRSALSPALRSARLALRLLGRRKG